MITSNSDTQQVLQGPTKPETDSEQKRLQQKKPAKKKLKMTPGKPNTFDALVDSKLIVQSAIARVRRQQLKVIKAIQEHHNAMNSFEDFVDDRVQVMIDEYLKPKADLKSLELPMEEMKLLLRKPEAFQPLGVIDPDSFHFGHTEQTYQTYIKKLEAKHKVCERRAQYSKEMKPFLRLPNLNECGWMKCSGCGNYMFECHDVEYGLFCVYMCIKYCQEAEGFCTDVGVKKVFIDTYNRCLEFVKFRMRLGEHEEYEYPPLCMQDNSLRYAVFWYEWVIEGRWDFNTKWEGFDEEDEDEDEDENDY